MTLNKEIKKEPYLKISNLTDIEDCDYAIELIRKLNIKYNYPNSKQLQAIIYRISKKRKQLENKQKKILGTMAKLKKGSKEAKEFMAKIRAKKRKVNGAKETKELKTYLKKKKVRLPHGYKTVKRKRKISGDTHTDTKSHNYRINISGAKKSKLFGVPSDRDAIREIELYAENNPQLYYSRTLPILKNLAKKYVKGTFDVNKSAKLWQYYVEDAMKRYHKDFGGTGSWSKLLTVEDRKTLARELAETTLDNFQHGAYQDYI